MIMSHLQSSVFKNNNKSSVESDLFKNNGNGAKLPINKAKKVNSGTDMWRGVVSIVNNCFYF